MSARATRAGCEFIRHAKAPELPVILLEDLAALLGLILALIGVSLAVITGDGLWDGIGTISIGVLLVLVAVVLAVETKSLLLGEGALTERRRQDHRGRPGRRLDRAGASTCRPCTSGRTNCWSR